MAGFAILGTTEPDFYRVSATGIPRNKSAGPGLVCYTAVFRVVTKRSSPQSGEERCVTTLKTAVWQTTCICKQTSVIVKNTLEYEDMETEMKDIPEVLKKNG